MEDHTKIKAISQDIRDMNVERSRNLSAHCAQKSVPRKHIFSHTTETYMEVNCQRLDIRKQWSRNVAFEIFSSVLFFLLLNLMLFE